MRRSWPVGAKLGLAMNSLAVLVFAALFLHSLWADLDARRKYTELDRAGAINAAALAQFHPSHGFTPENHRLTVPRYLVGAALDGQRASAILGGCLALLNLLPFALWIRTARRNAPAQDMGT